MGASGVAEPLMEVLASLAAVDPETLDDQSVRDSTLAFLECLSRLNATIARFVGVFDDRKLAERDGFPKTARWLEAYGRLSGSAACARVRAANITRALPKLGAAFDAGAVDAEAVNRIGLTAEQVGPEVVRDAEDTLVDLARVVDADTVRAACNYLRDEALRDRSTPPERQYRRRGITVARLNDMWHLTGVLDAETGTLLRTALDAFSGAPIRGDDRSPAQRRHDALADLLNASMRDGVVPAQGGVRPQIGLLMPVRRYADLHDHTGGHTGDETGDHTGGHITGQDGQSSGASAAASPFGPAPDDGNGPAVLAGWGPIPDALASRLSCDATLQQLWLHPDNGVPLRLGRAYRNTPPALRRALAARDPQCRWPGCTIPASWCDSHHLREWVRDNGATDVDNLVILCRYHHVCVHERGWGLHRDHATGDITITRPDGTPYELGPSRPRVDGYRYAGGRWPFAGTDGPPEELSDEVPDGPSDEDQWPDRPDPDPPDRE